MDGIKADRTWKGGSRNYSTNLVIHLSARRWEMNPTKSFHFTEISMHAVVLGHVQFIPSKLEVSIPATKKVTYHGSLWINGGNIYII